MTSPSRSIRFESRIHYAPVDEASAREFLTWKYDPPYDIYNYSPEYFERDLAYHLDPANNLHSMRIGGELVGYCSFGRDAQVLGGDYSEDALDIGMMIKPELTGQGMGSSYVASVIQHASTQYKPKRLRVTIMVSNLRARRVWGKNGFIMSQQFTGNMGDKGQTDFVILTKLISNT